MPRDDRWPSKWWFWGLLIGSNAYLLLLMFVPAVIRRAGLSLPSGVWSVLLAPARLFSEFVGEPVMEALELEALEAPLLSLGVGLALWELAAVVLALVCYGAAALVYAIVPGESGKGKGPGDGSG